MNYHMAGGTTTQFVPANDEPATWRNMSSIAQQYVELWRERVKGWHPTPSRLETAAYLVTEAAEALDAVLRMEQPDHDRTNGHHVKAGLEREIGQIMDMTLTLANLYGIDAHGAMYAWMGEVEDRSLAKVAERNGTLPS